MTTNYGVHFDPFDSKRMFISYTASACFASRTAGATPAALPNPRVNGSEIEPTSSKSSSASWFSLRLGYPCAAYWLPISRHALTGLYFAFV